MFFHPSFRWSVGHKYLPMFWVDLCLGVNHIFNMVKSIFLNLKQTNNYKNVHKCWLASALPGSMESWPSSSEGVVVGVCGMVGMRNPRSHANWGPELCMENLQNIHTWKPDDKLKWQLLWWDKDKRDPVILHICILTVPDLPKETLGLLRTSILEVKLDSLQLTRELFPWGRKLHF